MKTRNKIINTLALIIFLIGVGVISYPTISDLWNRHLMLGNIVVYNETFTKYTTDEALSKIIEDAKEYNRELYKSGENHISEYTLKSSGENPEDQMAGKVINPDPYYESMLNVTDDNMMGYISIPKIDVLLPIRHYNTEEVLSNSVGHVYGSSLPCGGQSSHCVLAAHSALSSAKLFTDLPKLEMGDEFTITVANQETVYSVDKIDVVLPDELASLGIKSGKDYVTLVTCTPYGVNTHRLLVRGVKVSSKALSEEELIVNTKQTKASNQDIPFYIVHFPVCFGIVLLILLIIVVFILILIWKQKEDTVTISRNSLKS